MFISSPKPSPQKNWSSTELEFAKKILRQQGTEADLTYQVASLIESIWECRELYFEHGNGRSRIDILIPKFKVVIELKRPGQSNWNKPKELILNDNAHQLARYMVNRRGTWLGILTNGQKWFIWSWNNKRPGMIIYLSPRKPIELCRAIEAIGYGYQAVAELTNLNPTSLGYYDGSPLPEPKNTGCLSIIGVTTLFLLLLLILIM